MHPIEFRRRMMLVAVWLMILAVVIILVGVWWWALFGLRESIGIAIGVTAGIFGLASCYLGVVFS